MNHSIATVGAPAPSAWRLRIALPCFVVGVLGPVLGELTGSSMSRAGQG